MKILIVFTGGTIGSKAKNGIADIDDSTMDDIAALCNAAPDVFEYTRPFSILSENADCETLSHLCTFMLSIDYDRYDGVIVTHGSDTLAYSAAMLSHVLSWVSIPVVITAANYIIGHEHSNAKDNLIASYNLIKTFLEGIHNYSGIFVVWKNIGSATEIHLAKYLLEADSFDRFRSWGDMPLGVFDNGNIIWLNDDIYRELREKNDSLSFLKNRNIAIKNNVLMMHSFVGLDYGAINIKGKEAVLLKLYHSGTACMKGERTSFRCLAEMCKNNGVDLYITPAKSGSYHYISESGFENSGAAAIGGMSEFAAYTALLLAYSLDGAEKRAVLDLLF